MEINQGLAEDLGECLGPHLFSTCTRTAAAPCLIAAAMKCLPSLVRPGHATNTSPACTSRESACKWAPHSIVLRSNSTRFSVDMCVSSSTACVIASPHQPPQQPIRALYRVARSSYVRHRQQSQQRLGRRPCHRNRRQIVVHQW